MKAALLVASSVIIVGAIGIGVQVHWQREQLRREQAEGQRKYAISLCDTAVKLGDSANNLRTVGLNKQAEGLHDSVVRSFKACNKAAENWQKTYPDLYEEHSASGDAPTGYFAPE